MTAPLVQIEKPVYGGSFLARLEGKAIFVPLALPGEQVRIRILEDRRGYANAEVEEFVSLAPERTPGACRHFGTCGGCHYQHADYAAQLKFKQAILEETLARAGVDPGGRIEVLSDRPWAYRNRIRLAFEEGAAGYRGRRSHRVVSIAECPIAAPLLVRSALALKETLALPGAGLNPSQVSLFCNSDESSLLATIFVPQVRPRGLDGLASEWRARTPELCGLELVPSSRAGTKGPGIARWGRNWLEYPAAGFGYRVDNGCFFQVNRWLVDALVEKVVGGTRGSLAWDLYAGVGLFAKKLSRQFERVVAVESERAATSALKTNLAGGNAEAVAADTLAFLGRKRGGMRPDLVVVDPPRTGLGAEPIARLAEVAPPAIVYVSCDPATLARDLKALGTSGYAIESVILADLFPQTFHIESVVRLARR